MSMLKNADQAVFIYLNIPHMVDNGENFEHCYWANHYPNQDDTAPVKTDISHVSVHVLESAIGGL